MNFGWYSPIANGRTRQVGTRQPNALGLHDMHGNVWEWCWDGYGGTFPNPADLDNPTGPVISAGRVIRGGSWFYPASITHSAFRGGSWLHVRNYSIGFRVVRP